MTEPTLSAEYVLSRAPLTEISEIRHSVRRKPSSSASKPIADRAAPRLPVFSASKSALNITLVRPAYLTFLYHKAGWNVSAIGEGSDWSPLPPSQNLNAAPRLFFRSTSRSVEVNVLAGVPATCARTTAVNFPGLVIDVGAPAGFWRDVASVCSFVGTGVASTVTVLQVALRCMVSAVVFVAGVAFAPAEAIRGPVCRPRFYSNIVARLRRAVVRHGNLQIW